MYSNNVKVEIIKFIAGAALLSGILLAPNSSLGALPGDTGPAVDTSSSLTRLRPADDLFKWDRESDRLPWSFLQDEKALLPTRRHWPDEFDFYEPQRTFCTSEVPKEPYTQRLLASCQVGLQIPRL